MILLRIALILLLLPAANSWAANGPFITEKSTQQKKRPKAKKQMAKTTKKTTSARKPASLQGPNATGDNATASSSKTLVRPKAEIIEGARRNTKLFVDFDAHTPNMDAIIFRRDDFNDFHAIDIKQRFFYQKVEVKKK